MTVCFLALSACQPRPPASLDIDREKLSITLERSACFGSCPDYAVTIKGDGQVVFSTPDSAPSGLSDLRNMFAPYVLLPGRHEDRIDPTAVDALVQEFGKANFFYLRDRYEADVTDNPTYVITIDTGRFRKQVIDYVGESAGMPESVTRLEDEIDRVAGTARWIRGADGLVDWLSRTGFEFRSRDATLLLFSGVGRADEATLVDLVDRARRWTSTLPSSVDLSSAGMLRRFLRGPS
jgi:hypothetical protein